MVKTNFFVFFTVLIIITGAMKARGADIYMDIKTSGSTAIEVAVPEFSAEGDLIKGKVYFHLSSTMSKIVQNDLDFSGLFKIIRKNRFIQEQEQADLSKGQIDFLEWGALGAVALVKGRFYMEKGRLVLEGELFDVDKGKRIIGVRYSGDPRVYRTIAHRLSDEIVYRLTGEKGIFRTRIVFLSKRRSIKELFIMDFDGKNPYPLTRERALVVTPAWSPRGEKVSFTSYIDRNPDLYVMNTDGSERKTLSMFPGLNVGAAWSPDGKKIAMVISKDGNPEIYLLNVATRKFRRLTRNRAIDSSPAWSPDGKSIAFTSGRSGTPQIYIMDANGKNVRRITYWGKYNDQAEWSPEGNLLAFTGKQDDRFDIYTMHRSGGRLKKLTGAPGNHQSPSWSPDGRYVAFSSDRNGMPQIYVIRSDGSGERRITQLAGGGYSPGWSPRQ